MDTDQRINYSELVDIPKLQALLESFYQVIDIPNAVLDVDGRIIAGAGWRTACTQFHRVNTESCRRCVESDTSLVDSMTRGVPYAVYRCLNGLVDAAAPITVEGRHVANVFTGQFLTEPPDIEFFRNQARQFGFDETLYLEAISNLPVLARERVESITRLYAQLASMLADSGMDRLKQKKAAAELVSLNEILEQKVIDRTQEVKEGHLILNGILGTTPDGYLRIDQRGRLVDVNPAYCLQSGYSREELLQLNISDLDAAMDRAEIKARIERIRETHNDQFESKHRRKDGSIWHVEVSATPHGHEEQQIIGFIP